MQQCAPSVEQVASPRTAGAQTQVDEPATQPASPHTQSPLRFWKQKPGTFAGAWHTDVLPFPGGPGHTHICSLALSTHGGVSRMLPAVGGVLGFAGGGWFPSSHAMSMTSAMAPRTTRIRCPPGGSASDTTPRPSAREAARTASLATPAHASLSDGYGERSRSLSTCGEKGRDLLRRGRDLERDARGAHEAVQVDGVAHVAQQ